MNTNTSFLQDAMNKFNGLFAIEIYGSPCPTWWVGEFDEEEPTDDPWLTYDVGYAACFTSEEEAIENCENLSKKYPSMSFRVTGI